MPKTSFYQFRVEDNHIVGDLAFQVSTQCQECKHFDLYSPSCKAFPNGIIENILNGSFDHTKKHSDQGNDIVFEKREE